MNESSTPPRPTRAPADDSANDWDAVAADFIANRSPTIGVAVVGAWAARLPARATVLDLGCGLGEPHGKQLVDAGVTVFGIDASPTLVAECRRRVPQMSVVCERVEHSALFGRRFEGIVAIGLIFLLKDSQQHRVLDKAAAALVDGGRLLFTAPWQACEWEDALTGRRSCSLGRATYVELLARRGLSVADEMTDEGDNHYFHFVRQ